MILFIYFYFFLAQASSFLKSSCYFGKALLLSLLFILFFFAAFRFNAVFDYHAYLYVVDLAILNIDGFKSFFSFYSDVFKIEPVSLFFVWVSGLTPIHESVFILFSFFSVFFIYLATKKLSPLPVLSLFVFFSHEYFYLFNGQIRAGLALVIAYYALAKFLERDYLVSLFWLLTASFTHFSLFVFFPVFIYLFLFRKYLGLQFPVFLVFVASAIGLGGFFGDLLIYFFDLIGEPGFIRRYIADGSPREYVDLTLLKASFFLAVSLYYLRFSHLRYSFIFRSLVVMLAFGISVRLLLVDFAELGGRLSSLFLFSLIFIIPFIACVSRYRTIWILCFMMLASAQFIVNYFKIGLYNFNHFWIFQ